MHQSTVTKVFPARCTPKIGVVAQWFVRRTPGGMVWVRAPVRGAVLCSWERYFIFPVPRFTAAPSTDFFYIQNFNRTTRPSPAA